MNAGPNGTGDNNGDGVRPFPWMPTVVIALVIVVVYILIRGKRQSR